LLFKKAVENDILKEPFSIENFKKICENIISGDTYKIFLNKHRKDNTRNETELFIKNEAKYSLIRPFKKYKCKELN